MADTMQPSTHWKEQIAADEAERFARYGEQFAAIQARKSAKYGNGRALHRKQLTAAQGTLECMRSGYGFRMVAWIARGMPFPTFAGLRSAFSV